MKRTGFVMAVAAVCGSAFAQTTAPVGASDDAARVRFINLAAAAPAAGLNWGPHNLFPEVPFGTATEIKSLADTDKEFKITLTVPGGESVDSPQKMEFDDDDDVYTVLALGDKDTGQPFLATYSSDRLEPASDRAQVTLVNAVSDVRALDLFLGDKKLHAGVNFGGHNGPDKVAPGTHTLSVKTNDEKVVMKPVTVDLAPGRSYTVVAYGTLVQGPAAKIIEDATGKEVAQQAASQTSGAYTPAAIYGTPAVPYSDIVTTQTAPVGPPQ